MKNVIFNIKNLTINFGAAAKEKVASFTGFGIPASNIGDIFESIFADIRAAHEAEQKAAAAGEQAAGGEATAETSNAEGEFNPVAETAADAAEPEAVVEAAPYVSPITTDNVLAFLVSNSDFTLRSFGALVKHFGANDDDAKLHELSAKLAELDHDGSIETKTRRSDKTAVYRALRAPGSEHTAKVYPELTVNNMLTFLKSHVRFTLRTATAIAKHFGLDPHDAKLVAFLRSMAADGDIQTKTRRRDRQPLFRALRFAAVAAPVAEAAPAAATEVSTADPASPEINGDNVMAFLRSNGDFRMRSLRAIAKHFGVEQGDVNLDATLQELVREGDVEVRTKRSDRSVKLYEAA